VKSGNWRNGVQRFVGTNDDSTHACNIVSITERPISTASRLEKVDLQLLLHCNFMSRKWWYWSYEWRSS